jgi:amino acid adenylation domain-containing protein
MNPPPSLLAPLAADTGPLTVGDVFVLPCSFAQQRLWLVDQMDGGSPAYALTGTVRLRGPLRVDALGRALDEEVRRHEALRTTFGMVDGEPVQVIRPAAPVPLPVVELPAPAGEAGLHRRLREEAERPFDLRQGPLFRAMLLRLGEEEHVLMLMMHHVVTDGWSMGVLFRELSQLYGAFCNGEPSPLPELSIQYADFAGWQREALRGGALDAQLAFWRGALNGAPALLVLPADRPRPATQSYRGAHEEVSVAPGTTAALHALARREGATLYMVLLAAWQLLLARYAGTDDLVVGTPIAGRTRPELEGLIGFFVNTLALRADLSGDPTFRGLLARVREATLGAYAHQDVPFERLVDELQPERSLSHNPIFQAFFAFANTPDEALAFPGIEVSPIPVLTATAKFDLALGLGERDGALDGFLEYAVDLFDAATVRRLGEHLGVLLEAVAADPDRRISALPILSAAERLQVVEAWNPDAGLPAPDVCLHELFELQATLAPGRVALVHADERTTYGELNGRANRLARHLRGRGVDAGSRVGICLERGTEMLVAVLGVLKAGAAYVPFDPAYPAERLAYMAEDSGVSVLLTQRVLLDRLPAAGVPLVCLDAGPEEEIARESGENLQLRASPDSLAYVIYTSGSTGRPKGAMLTHAAVVRLFSATDTWFCFGADDVWTLFHSFAFDFSVWEIWGALLHGGRLVVVPFLVSRSAEQLRHLLRDEGVTVLNQTPTAFQQLVQADALEAEPLEALRLVVFAGEALQLEGLRPWLDRYGPERPRLVNMYGITETCVHSTYHQVSGADLQQAGVGTPIGVAIPDLRLHVLDPAAEPVPVGVPGELYVGGPALARGYLGRPGLTAARFVPDPFARVPGERLYRSGDRARRRADGTLEFLGRIDQQVKIRGFRVEPGEVEAALLESPLVRECVVVARDDGAEKRLVGYVVAEAGAAPGARELREAVAKRLPAYMVPAAFLVLDRIPLTANGKVDRRALPAPEDADAGGDGGFVAPRTPVEEVLAGIWAGVLKLERVGVLDDFFALGGHSLRATQVLSRVQEALRVELPLRTLFEQPTVAGVAEALEAMLRGATGTVLPPLVAAADGDEPAPLSFSQQRLWFLERLQPGGHGYNVPAALRLEGALDAPALERALAEVVRRHDVLRTTFGERGERPVQVVWPADAFPFRLEASEPPPEAVWSRVAEEAWRPFDLERGPLFRAHLFRLDEREHVLVTTAHHAVFDGWSGGVLAQELAALYVAFSAGEPSPLPELALQYADYARWQHEWLRGPVLEAQVAHWRAKLEGVPVLELPTDRPRPPVQAHRGAVHRFELPEALAAAVRALARRESATPYMVLLAAFHALLARWTGQDDGVVGTPIANRTRREVEPLIGFFANTLALRGDTSGDPAFRALVRRVREGALDAYAHQDLPFEKLVEELRVERDLSRNPLVQAMFVLQTVGMELPALAGVEVSAVELGADSARLDLVVALRETPEGLEGMAEYDVDLFDAATIARLMGHFHLLLEGACADPALPLSALPLLGAGERRALLEEWNATGAAYPEDACIHTLFEAQAARTPEAVALVFEGERVTYAELDARANRLARHLAARGVGPETRVGVALERSVELLVGLLGVLKAGGAYVPLDPGEPRLAWLLADAAVPVLLAQARLLGALPAHDAAVVCLDEGWPEIARESPEPLAVESSPDRLAYVIYTSGSTGRPKGVMNAHRGVCNRLLWMQGRYALAPGDRVLQKTPVSFDVSVWELFWPLLAGATLVVARPGGHREPAYLAGLIEAEEVGVAHFVPSMLQAFLDEPAAERCTSLRHVVCSGEALPPALQERFFARLGGARLHNLYGPTEAAVDVTAWECRAGTETVPIGAPIANTRAYVLEPGGGPAPVGVPGELFLGGVQVARGYLGRPALTAERFVPDPFGGAGARLYRTGDRARWRPDGVLEFLGRLDFQVKIRGFRVEPGEVEAALLAHPAVREAVVAARGDGPGGPRLVAWVVGADAPPEPASLRAFLRERLPEHMVPAAFVALEALPLTASGKLDRRALPAPEPDARPDGAFAAPGSALQEAISAAWREVLGVERVGVEDNFFDLGGHSLLIPRLARLLRPSIPGLTMVSLFRYPTILSLARSVEGGEDAAPAGGREQGERRRELNDRQQSQRARRQAALDARDGGA